MHALSFSLGRDRPFIYLIYVWATPEPYLLFLGIYVLYRIT